MQFLFAPPAFDFGFAVARFLESRKSFGINQRYRAPYLCVMRSPFGTIVLDEPLFEIVRASDIEGRVGALEDINEVHTFE